MAYFMKHANIQGESKVAGRDGFIELTSLTWSMAATQSQRKGGQGSQGMAVQDIACTKLLDTSSALLMQELVRGTAAEVIIEFVTTGANDRPQTVWKVVLQGCRVSSYATAGGGTDRPQDSFTLNFEKFNVEVFGTDDALLGTSLTMGFDVFNGVPV